MGGGSVAKQYPLEYLGAAAISAGINYPLWRASAIGQSGFQVEAAISAASGSRYAVVRSVVPQFALPYVYAFAPPYKGMAAVVSGMTWARGFIFWGSDRGRDVLLSYGGNKSTSTILPPLVISTFVQCVNQPLVRASITLQNPAFNCPNTTAALKHIYNAHGLKGLWHGTSAGILKTVPKYCTAIIVKDYMESILPAVDPDSRTVDSDRLWRSACKSSVAGVAGAALTNPLDVIRNEMFKTNKSLVQAVISLYEELGYNFMFRGMGKNMVAVAIPVGCTIFFTDALIQLSKKNKNRNIHHHQENR